MFGKKKNKATSPPKPSPVQEALNGTGSNSNPNSAPSSPRSSVDIPKTDWSKITPTHTGPRPDKEVLRFVIPPDVKTLTRHGYSFQRLLNRIVVRNPEGYFCCKLKDFPDYIPSNRIAGQEYITKTGVVSKFDTNARCFKQGLLKLDKGIISFEGDTDRTSGEIYTADYMYPKSESSIGLDDNIRDYNCCLAIRTRYGLQKSSFYVQFASEGDCRAWKYSILHNFNMTLGTEEKVNETVQYFRSAIIRTITIGEQYSNFKFIDWRELVDALYDD